jgi:NitT/TauT family transport system substrate-binding protein
MEKITARLFWLVFGCYLLTPQLLDAQQVKVAVPGQLALAPFHVAVEKGYYAREGLQVQLIQMRDTVANQALIGGNVEFVTAGGGTVVAILAGLPARIIFTGFHRPFWDLIAQPSLAKVSQLKGKKVGIPGGIGGAPDTYLREVLKRYGLEGGRDVTILAMGGSSAAFVGLTSGATDAAVLSAEAAVRALELGNRKLLSFADDDLDLITVSGGIGVREGLLQSDRNLVEKFVRASLKGLIYAREHPEGTVPIWAKRNKLTEEFGTKVFKMLLPAMTENGIVSSDVQRKAIEQFYRRVGLKEPPSMERVFDYSFTRKVFAQLKAQEWRP